MLTTQQIRKNKQLFLTLYVCVRVLVRPVGVCVRVLVRPVVVCVSVLVRPVGVCVFVCW